MKKTYLKSAVGTLGIFTTAVALYAQGAGGGGAGGAGGGAGGAAGGAAAGGTAVGGTAAGARVSGGTATRATTTTPSGAANSGVARGLNTRGGASILAPAATPPIGASSTLGPAGNTVGGSASGNTFISPPGTAGSTAALPSGVSNPQQSIPLTTLPGPVQTALQGLTANGQVGSVTQIQGLNGPLYRAQVTENGVPMELQISQTGQILSRTAGTASVGPVSAAAQAPTTLGNVQAGLPVSSLPEAVQNSLQTQLGANGLVQTVSRDDLANGTVFRVTTTQNGVPTEMRFGANGTFLGSTPINGTVTSPFVATGGVLPGTAVVMSDLPAGVQSAIRSQLGTGRLNQLTQIQGTNGLMYAVSYDMNGRPMVMTIGPDGRVISNNPIAGVGNPATRATGSGSSSTRTNNSNRTSMRMEELPASVQETLRREARGAEVRSVTREKRVGGDVYTVSVRGENNAGDLTIGQDGKVVSDNRRTFAELTVPKAPVDDEKVTGIPYNTVPVAIQNAIKAYATASDILSITLGSDNGKVVYDVIYYHNGQRDRMIVQKDGTVRRIDQNVSPALEIADPKKTPVIAMGDVPQAVRDTIRRQTEGVSVKDITTKQVGSETVYQVHYRTNGAPVELLVSMDGRVVVPEGSLDREAAGSAQPAPIGAEELASAKVIPANDAPAHLENTGTAASSEKGSVNSNAATGATPSAQSAPASNVSISDVPVPVQNTAKKLAGSATIDSISPKLSDSGVTYEVAFLQNGGRKTVVVNKDGVVISE